MPGQLARSIIEDCGQAFGACPQTTVEVWPEDELRLNGFSVKELKLVLRGQRT